ncbi:MAG: response regulator [Firmicutes bacterium]|nr:response regulator [Bacillota bacterium]
MGYQPIDYAWTLFGSALVSLGVGALVWPRRRVPGARPFILLMAISVVWSLSNALEMMGLDLSTKLFWANVQYICYGTIPVAGLVLTLQYVDRASWLSHRRVMALLVEPVVTVVLALTNQWHGLLRRDVFLDLSGPFPVIAKTYGIWFWVHAAYSYALMVAAAAIIATAARNMARLYRLQTLSLLIGFSLPFVVSLAFTFGLSPFGFDVAPIAFSITGALLSVSLFRYKLFDLVPAGYSLVVASMGDGMIIFDESGRIVDINPITAKIIGAGEDVIGSPISPALAYHSTLEHAVQTECGREELIVKGSQKTEYYDARWWPITDIRGRRTGRVLLLRDTTETKEAQQEALRQQRLAAMLQERERVARELHDGVGQVLGYVGLQANAMLSFLDDGAADRVRDCLRRLVVVAKQSHMDVRDFIQTAMSPILADSGLFEAVNALLERFTETHGIEAHLVDSRSDPQRSFSPAVDAQILRIVQEALTNVRRHAAAKHVTVFVTDTDDRVHLVIRDDGRGFDPRRVDGTRSFGVRIMQERAAEIGGRLEVVSSPGRGTEVQVEIPYFPSSEAPVAVAAGQNDCKKEEFRGMRVLLADDHPLYLDALTDLLTAHNIQVVGTARDGLDAVKQAERLVPDVVIMDVVMHPCDGLTATRLIKSKLPQVKVLILTMVDTEDIVLEAMQSGASGYLLKDLDSDELVRLLATLERGRLAFSPNIGARYHESVARVYREAAEASTEKQMISQALSDRQVEILTMAARGMTYRQIAGALSLGVRTVKYHMAEIITKLNVKDRREAIDLARKARL